MPGFANRDVYLVASLRYVHIIPSPRVGSGVDVRQTMGVPGQCVRWCHVSIEGRLDVLSTFSKVKMPRRSNCVPLDVTVKFKLIPAHEPTGPQFVGGLEEKTISAVEHPRARCNLRELHYLRPRDRKKSVYFPVFNLGRLRTCQTRTQTSV